MTETARPYWVHSNPDQPEAPRWCVACHEQPAYRGSLMCGGCFGRLRGDLDVLVFAHTCLGADMAALRPAFRPSGGGHQAAGARMPFDPQRHDLRVTIELLLTTWARAAAEEHQPAIQGPADGQMRTVGRWLADVLPWISDQYWCDAMAAEFADAAVQARGLVPWEPRRHNLPGPCPGCGMLSLTLWRGDAVVLCRVRSCGRRVSWPQYWEAVKGLDQAALSLQSRPPTSSEGVAA